MRGFFSLLPWTLVFLLPALTMRMWSEERKFGTLEVLLTWPVREREAVLGKFLGGLGLLAVSLAGTFPIAFTVFALGNPDRGPVLAGYLGLLFFGAAGLAVGIYASALTENQIVAYVAGVAMTFALFVAGEDFVVVAAPAVPRPAALGRRARRPLLEHRPRGDRQPRPAVFRGGDLLLPLPHHPPAAKARVGGGRWRPNGTWCGSTGSRRPRSSPGYSSRRTSSPSAGSPGGTSPRSGSTASRPRRRSCSAASRTGS